MKSVNTAWCPHDYEKSSPLHVPWTRVTYPMGTRLTEEDQIAHAFRRLSLFFTAHASLFYPLGMCFRSRAFRRLFFSTAHPYRRLIFFPLHMRSVVSLFISAVHPFSRLLVMKSREKRPGMLLRRWCVTASLKALPKISDQNMWYSLSFNSDNW